LPARARAEPKDDGSASANPAAASLGLSELAFRNCGWLADHSGRGLTDPIDGSAMLPYFEGVPIQDLQDAIAELEIDGYVTTRSFAEELPHIIYGIDLFANFDPLTRGTDPTVDAAALGRIALELGEWIGVRDLHGRTDWNLRRFNPALTILVSHVDDRRVSQSGDNEYPTHFFALLPADRVAIKRFVERHPVA